MGKDAAVSPFIRLSGKEKDLIHISPKPGWLRITSNVVNSLFVIIAIAMKKCMTLHFLCYSEPLWPDYDTVLFILMCSERHHHRTTYLLPFYRFSKVYSYLIYLVSPKIMVSASSCCLCLIIYFFTGGHWLADLHKEAYELYLQLASRSYAVLLYEQHVFPISAPKFLLSFVPCP